MTFRCRRLRWLAPTVGSLVLVLAAADASTGAPKRVLVLHSFGLDIAPFSAVAAGLRISLARELGAPVDLDEVTLDADRFDDASYRASLVELLASRLATRPVDLVVTNGAPAIGFVGEYRDRLFPRTPAIFAGGDPRVVPSEFLGPDTYHVSQWANLPGMIEDILQLKPDTTEIAVIFGASALERFWEAECRREFAAAAGRVKLTWLTGLPLGEVTSRCAALPPHSFVLFVFLVVDADGSPYAQNEVLLRLRQSANAPVFGYFASALGNGIVGGRLYQDAELGVQTGRAAALLLRGAKPAWAPRLLIGEPTPTYDSRELRRWGISEARLPAGSVVLFRQPTTWQRQWRWITAVAAFLLLQTGLIAVLLVNRAKRREAEGALREFGRGLIRSQEDGRSQLARELHDDVTQRLARLAIDVGVVERDPGQIQVAAAMRPVREELARLSEDVHTLAYRLHPSILEDLGLAATLRAEAERFSRQHGIVAEVTLTGMPEVVPPEPALCLYRVAQEALRNVARHAGARTVHVSLRGRDGGLQLAIHDDGAGFVPELVRGSHMGLGLTSMRERVRLLRGTLDIESAPGRGTTVAAWVPLRGEPR